MFYFQEQRKHSIFCNIWLFLMTEVTLSKYKYIKEILLLRNKSQTKTNSVKFEDNIVRCSNRLYYTVKSSASSSR